MQGGHFTLEAHPGDIDFRAWLGGRTPAHAPTLLVNAPGGRGPIRLPRLRPASLPTRRRARRGAAPAIHSAFLVDIEGMTPRALAGSRVLGFSSERGARQHLREGRFIASELGLWPWAVAGGASLHRAWWTDERFAAALRTWAVELHAPEVEPAVRRLSPAVRLPIA